MALKAKSSDTNESSDDKDSKMKSYITKQFKNFTKNANARGSDKDHNQSNSSQFKNQDKGKKDAKDSGQYTSIRTKMLWVSRLRSHEIRVPYVSQDHWEKQGTCCYFERHEA